MGDFAIGLFCTMRIIIPFQWRRNWKRMSMYKRMLDLDIICKINEEFEQSHSSIFLFFLDYDKKRFLECIDVQTT